jgi:Tol biopolymer transport system component
MAEQLDFETALERRLHARASMATRPFDAAAIASAAVVARPARRLALPWTFRGLAWGWVAVMLATLAIVGGTLLAGALLRDPYQGPWLAYTSTDGVYLAHEDGTYPRSIVGTDHRIGPIRWAADGTLLAAIDMDIENEDGWFPRLLVLDTQGRVKLSVDGVSDVVWSRTGHRLAWISLASALMITDVDTGGTSTILPDTEEGMISNPSWSADDTEVVVTWSTGTVSGLRVVGLDGSVRDLGRPGLSGPARPVWSPDGRTIAAFAADAERCGIPDGSCPGSIVLVDAGSGDVVATIGEVDTVLGMQWSPDGTRLAWDVFDLSTPQENLFVGQLPLATGTVVQVTDWPGSAWLLDWTNDGTSLLAGHTARLEDGTGREPHELWRVPVDAAAGEPVLLRSDVFMAQLQPTP